MTTRGREVKRDDDQASRHGHAKRAGLQARLEGPDHVRADPGRLARGSGSARRSQCLKHPVLESESVADAGVGADQYLGPSAGSILRRRLATWARRTAMSLLRRDPQTSTSSARWVISRPRLRASARSRPNSVGVRWTSSPSRATPNARRGRSRAHRRRSSAPPLRPGARRSAACSRAISSRGPNGLVT